MNDGRYTSDGRSSSTREFFSIRRPGISEGEISHSKVSFFPTEWGDLVLHMAFEGMIFDDFLGQVLLMLCHWAKKLWSSWCLSILNLNDETWPQAASEGQHVSTFGLKNSKNLDVGHPSSLENHQFYRTVGTQVRGLTLQRIRWTWRDLGQNRVNKSGKTWRNHEVLRKCWILKSKVMMFWRFFF